MKWTKIKQKKNIEIDDLFKKYENSVSKLELENLKNDADKNNKKYMSDYYQALINDIESKNFPTLYANKYMERFKTDKIVISNHFLFIYQFDFLNVISVLEIFINDILLNISNIPNSIKSICKIMSILLRNKFKDITKFQEISFLAKFFIEKLLIPIFKNPSTNALLNDFVITENTQYNL